MLLRKNHRVVQYKYLFLVYIYALLCNEGNIFAYPPRTVVFVLGELMFETNI